MDIKNTGKVEVELGIVKCNGSKLIMEYNNHYNSYLS